MSRLRKVERSDFPEELKYVWDRIETNGEVPNIFRTMGNNPALLRSYLRLGNGLWAECGLDLPQRELAILRTAILHRSMYEWHQHVRIGRQAGLTDERIVSLHHWLAADVYSEAERAMLAYIDAVAATEHPAVDIHQALARHFPDSTIVGINLLAGFYGMTAKFLGAMEVETEGPFVGWQLQG